MSRRKKASFLFFGEALNVFISFLIQPYLSRSLSLEDNGTYNQLVYLLLFFIGILQLGLPTIIYQFFEKHKNNLANVFLSNILALFCLGLIGTLILLIFQHSISELFDNPNIQSLIWVGALSIPFRIAQVSVNYTLIYQNKVKHHAIINLAYNSSRLLILFFTIQFLNSLYYSFFGLLLLDMVVFAISFALVPKQYYSPLRINIHVLVNQLKMGFYVGIGSSILVLFNQTDRLIISIYLDPKQLAIFHNGAITIPLVGVFLNSIATILLPDISRLAVKNRRKEIIELKRKVIGISSFVIFPIVLSVIAFSPELIKLYLSSKYASSWIVFFIFNTLLLFRANNYRDVLIAYGKTRIIIWVSIGCVVLNIILDLLIINSFGINGIAMATFISNLFLMGLLLRSTISFLNTSFASFVPIADIIKSLVISGLVILVFRAIFEIVNSEYLSLILVPTATLIIYILQIRFKILSLTSLTNNSFILKIEEIIVR